jgi:hypothetical protein
MISPRVLVQSLLGLELASTAIYAAKQVVVHDTLVTVPLMLLKRILRLEISSTAIYTAYQVAVTDSLIVTVPPMLY